jgi:predicted PurR-regulated permease PerM
MAVAFLLTPAVNFLQKQGVPRTVATVVMYIVVLAGLIALSYALIFSLIQQVITFQNTVINFFNALPTQYLTFRNFLINNGIPGTNIDDALNQIKAQAITFAQTAATNVVNIAFIVTNTLIDILLILVLSFYLTLDGKHVRDNLYGIVPDRLKKHFLLFEDALNRVVGNYIRGQLALAVIIGVLAGVGCFWLGLRNYALIIGVLAFLFETIPMVGPALASIPALLLSLLLPAPFPRTFWILVYFIAVQMVESNILGPRIVGHAVGLHPVASILALIIGAQLFGAFGALLATPIVAAAWVVIASLYKSLHGQTADEILAHRRRPWVIRRPSGLLHRGRKTNSTSGGEPHAALEIPAKEEDSKSDTLVAPIKGNSVHLDHIDLLRPVPDTKKTPNVTLDEEE